MAWRDRLTDLREAVEDRTGLAVERKERLEILESRSAEAGALRRELDALAWTALDYVGGNAQELKAVARRRLVQKARVVWMKDPQAGAAADLMNDFVFGSGLAKPKANDPAVQEVLDETWEDPDNELVLTKYPSQLAMGIDLSLQSNIFILVFDDGADGKVKLGLLEHDAVENVVRDPDNRLRIMYYVARFFRQSWDFENDTAKVDLTSYGARAEQGAQGKGEIRYFKHWRNVDLAEEEIEEGIRDAVDEDGNPIFAPDIKLGEGKVFQVSVNRTAEMAFGHPTMDRLLRWYNAYNRFIDARMDMIEAKAAFVMKRKVKGTPTQLAKQATTALSRRGVLGSTVIDDRGEEVPVGPRAASILQENDTVTHEEMSLDTGAQSAMADSQMIRAQVAAATRFPQSYYGDASQSNLATATSLELPVLKAVENRQEIFEHVVRFLCDRAIERAVDTGRISEELTPEELADRKKEKEVNPAADYEFGPAEVTEAYEGQPADEEETQRDLGYEFSMPNPLKRLINDLITAVQTIATTFDPNNTNMELSRTLLTFALGEALEVEDPAGLVDKIFPPGYVDPAVAAAQAQGAPPAAPRDQGANAFGEFGPGGQQQGVPGADGQRHPPGNAYGAPQRAQPPEAMQQAVTRGRDGQPVAWPLHESRRTLPSDLAATAAARSAEAGTSFDSELARILAEPEPNGDHAKTNGSAT